MAPVSRVMESMYGCIEIIMEKRPTVCMLGPVDVLSGRIVYD